MALRDRMKVNWAELTLQEKKACKVHLFFLPHDTFQISGTQGIWAVRMTRVGSLIMASGEAIGVGFGFWTRVWVREE
jgi:hypothetical protein